MGNLSCCCTQVHESTVAIKERFGKFEQVLEPGCHFVPCILGYRLAGTLSLRLQEFDVKCEATSQNNVYVNVAASVQCRVLADKAREAFYQLSNPKSQIGAYMIPVIKASIRKLNLDEAFEQMDVIAKAVGDDLAQVMSDYGYKIVHGVINIAPDESLKRVMSEINAATEKAEVNKFLQTKKVELDIALQLKRAVGKAESEKVSQQIIACQRQDTVDGFRESVLGFVKSFPGTSAKDAMDRILTTQYLDTVMREVGATSKSSAIFIPHGPGAICDVRTQLGHGLFQAAASHQ